MSTLEIVLLSIFLVWITTISYFLYSIRRHYQALVTKTGKNELDKILDDLLKKETQNNSSVAEIKDRVYNLEQKNKRVLQKIGFLRFNPFERIAGDQSFLFSILDGERSGIILNFIYTREGIRVYGKQVKKGKGDTYELSKEEKEVMNQADT
jgi:hypothetical protein